LVLTPIFRAAWRRFLARDAVRVVSVTHTGAHSLASNLSVESQVIPHAAPREFFDARRERTASEGGPLKLIYVGELSEKKGVGEILARATWLQEHNIRLTIVGDGPLREDCYRAAREFSNLEYHGRVESRASMASIVAQHDVLILLSRRVHGWEELFGIVLIEAIAAGLGVVSTAHVGPVEILGDRHLQNLFDESDHEGPWDLILELSESCVSRRDFIEGHSGLAEPYRSERIAQLWSEALAKPIRGEQ